VYTDSQTYTLSDSMPGQQTIIYLLLVLNRIFSASNWLWAGRL